MRYDHFPRAVPPRVSIHALLAAFLVCLFLFPQPADAMNIQKVKSPGGIEVWLVEEHAVPLIAMRFGFMGGTSQDTDDKVGTAYFVSGMLDEGAGLLKSTEFQERVEELAVKMNFNADRDVFSGSFTTLSERRDEAFALLRLVLNEPRFDPDAADRIRRQIIDGLKFDENDPNRVAAKEWFKIAFNGHPYGRPTKGDEKSLNAIGPEDLKSYVRRVFTRDNLKIGVVGDINAKDLGVLLDKVFASLPEKSDLRPIPEAAPPVGPKRKIIRMKIPQSVAQFGFAGLKRKDKDFIPAFVLNHIIGGGGFSSKLMEEVREKRGLAYSVYSYLSPFEHGAAYLGSVATKNSAVGKSLEVIENVLARVAKDGPTEQELENVKRYLTGSYALRFDASSKIASQLLWVQIEDLGIDYIDKRNSLVEAVTLQDIRRVAGRLLKADGLIVTIVGQPEHLTESSPNGKSG